MNAATAIEQFTALQREGLMSPIDIEFCRFLSEVDSAVNRHVLLAACLASAAYQNGDVCIKLNDYAARELFEEAPEQLRQTSPNLERWRSILNKSPLVGGPGDFKPLILDDANRLYLHKLCHNEQNLVQQISAKINVSSPQVDPGLLKDGLRRLFDSDEEINWQQVAAVAAVYNTFTVISGGPGTGKTTTVVRLLALLLEQGRHRGTLPSVALAAPTGKAAARLESSILEAKEQLQVDQEIKKAIPVEAVTIHQLLGASRYTAHFRYNRDNPLPYDYIIIDEVSMIDQGLMSRLMDAMLTKTRLLLLGDKDQLASVEAGSVLGDLCGDQNQNYVSAQMKRRLQNLNINLPENTLNKNPQPLTDHIVLLKKSFRFDSESGIGQLARAVNNGKPDQVWSLLNNSAYPEITFKSFDNYTHFIGDLSQPILEHFKSIQASGSPSVMLEKYRERKILAAHRRGPWGVNTINSRVEQVLKKQGLITPYGDWYKGRPVIVNTNDYSLGLSNGDLGVCAGDHEGALKVYFETDRDLQAIASARLPNHSTAYALTVHKSQGSEFDNIYFVLPDRLSPILSRELIYTAVSRARKKVTLMGNREVLMESIRRTAARNSGLKDYFWK